ncbi:MAG TPA: hypothetical protein VM238_17960 [Phycisphaerae bacterium]|nr:hypothetical protein [Phycisphaerae bacterium]
MTPAPEVVDTGGAATGAEALAGAPAVGGELPPGATAEDIKAHFATLVSRKDADPTPSVARLDSPEEIRSYIRNKLQMGGSDDSVSADLAAALRGADAALVARAGEVLASELLARRDADVVGIEPMTPETFAKFAAAHETGTVVPMAEALTDPTGVALVSGLADAAAGYQRRLAKIVAVEPEDLAEPTSVDREAPDVEREVATHGFTQDVVEKIVGSMQEYSALVNALDHLLGGVRGGTRQTPINTGPLHAYQLTHGEAGARIGAMLKDRTGAGFLNWLQNPVQGESLREMALRLLIREASTVAKRRGDPGISRGYVSTFYERLRTSRAHRAGEGISRRGVFGFEARNAIAFRAPYAERAEIRVKSLAGSDEVAAGAERAPEMRRIKAAFDAAMQVQVSDGRGGQRPVFPEHHPDSRGRRRGVDLNTVKAALAQHPEFVDAISEVLGAFTGSGAQLFRAAAASEAGRSAMALMIESPISYNFDQQFREVGFFGAPYAARLAKLQTAMGLAWLETAPGKTAPLLDRIISAAAPGDALGYLFEDSGHKTLVGWSPESHITRSIDDYLSDPEIFPNPVAFEDGGVVYMPTVRIDADTQADVYQLLRNTADREWLLSGMWATGPGYWFMGALGDKTPSYWLRRPDKSFTPARAVAAYRALYEDPALTHLERAMLLKPEVLDKLLRDHVTLSRSPGAVSAQGVRRLAQLERAIIVPYLRAKFDRHAHGRLASYAVKGTDASFLKTEAQVPLASLDAAALKLAAAKAVDNLEKRSGTGNAGGMNLESLGDIPVLVLDSEYLAARMDGAYLFDGDSLGVAVAETLGKLYAGGAKAYSLKSYTRFNRPDGIAVLDKNAGTSVQSYVPNRGLRGEAHDPFFETLQRLMQAAGVQVVVVTSDRKTPGQAAVDAGLTAALGVKLFDESGKLLTPFDEAVALARAGVEPVNGKNFYVVQKLSGSVEVHLKPPTKQKAVIELGLGFAHLYNDYNPLADAVVRDMELADLAKNNERVAESLRKSKRSDDYEVAFANKRASLAEPGIGNRFLSSMISAVTRGLGRLTQLSTTHTQATPDVTAGDRRVIVSSPEFGKLSLAHVNVRVRGPGGAAAFRYVKGNTERGPDANGALQGFETPEAAAAFIAVDFMRIWRDNPRALVRDPRRMAQETADLDEAWRRHNELARTDPEAAKDIRPQYTLVLGYADVFEVETALEGREAGPREVSYAMRDGVPWIPHGAPLIRFNEDGSLDTSTIVMDDVVRPLPGHDGFFVLGSTIEMTRTPSDAPASTTITRAVSDFAEDANLSMIPYEDALRKGEDADGDAHKGNFQAGFRYDETGQGKSNRLFLFRAHQYRTDRIVYDLYQRSLGPVNEIADAAGARYKDAALANMPDEMIATNSDERFAAAHTDGLMGKHNTGISALYNTALRMMHAMGGWLRVPFTVTGEDGSAQIPLEFSAEDAEAALMDPVARQRWFLAMDMSVRRSVSQSVDDGKKRYLAYLKMSSVRMPMVDIATFMAAELRRGKPAEFDYDAELVAAGKLFNRIVDIMATSRFLDAVEARFNQLSSLTTGRRPEFVDIGQIMSDLLPEFLTPQEEERARKRGIPIDELRMRPGELPNSLAERARRKLLYRHRDWLKANSNAGSLARLYDLTQALREFKSVADLWTGDQRKSTTVGLSKMAGVVNSMAAWQRAARAASGQTRHDYLDFLDPNQYPTLVPGLATALAGAIQTILPFATVSETTAGRRMLDTLYDRHTGVVEPYPRRAQLEAPLSAAAEIEVAVALVKSFGGQLDPNFGADRLRTLRELFPGNAFLELLDIQRDTRGQYEGLQIVPDLVTRGVTIRDDKRVEAQQAFDALPPRLQLELYLHGLYHYGAGSGFQTRSFMPLLGHPATSTHRQQHAAASDAIHATRESGDINPSFVTSFARLLEGRVRDLRGPVLAGALAEYGVRFQPRIGGGYAEEDGAPMLTEVPEDFYEEEYNSDADLSYYEAGMREGADEDASSWRGTASEKLRMLYAPEAREPLAYVKSTYDPIWDASAAPTPPPNPATAQGHRAARALTSFIERAGVPAASASAEAVPAPVTLIGSSPYLAKDQAKSDRANKFIGRGSARSSTAKYAYAWGMRANTGQYEASDRVFVSVEGARASRLPLDRAEVQKAVAAEATIIADNAADRARDYNVGEKELEAFLKGAGYVEREAGSGEWTPAGLILPSEAQIPDAGLRAQVSAAMTENYAYHQAQGGNEASTANKMERQYPRVMQTTEGQTVAPMPGIKQNAAPQIWVMRQQPGGTNFESGPRRLDPGLLVTPGTSEAEVPYAAFAYRQPGIEGEGSTKRGQNVESTDVTMLDRFSEQLLMALDFAHEHPLRRSATPAIESDARVRSYMAAVYEVRRESGADEADSVLAKMDSAYAKGNIPDVIAFGEQALSTMHPGGYLAPSDRAPAVRSSPLTLRPDGTASVTPTQNPEDVPEPLRQFFNAEGVPDWDALLAWARQQSLSGPTRVLIDSVLRSPNLRRLQPPRLGLVVREPTAAEVGDGMNVRGLYLDAQHVADKQAFDAMVVVRPLATHASNYAKTVVHEYVHSVTLLGLKYDKAFAAEMTRLLELARAEPGLKAYGLTNEREFVAEIFSNQRFRYQLMAITDPSPRGPASGTLWDSVLAGLRNMLRRFTRAGSAVDNSVLESALNEIFSSLTREVDLTKAEPGTASVARTGGLVAAAVLGVAQPRVNAQVERQRAAIEAQDPVNVAGFLSHLRMHEGFRGQVYDTGTIGNGHNLVTGDNTRFETITGVSVQDAMSGTPISELAASELLRADAERALETASRVIPDFDVLPELVQRSLADLVFWGVYPNKFKKSVAAAKSGEWDRAADELIDSELYERHVKLKGPTYQRLMKAVTAFRIHARNQNLAATPSVTTPVHLRAKSRAQLLNWWGWSRAKAEAISVNRGDILNMKSRIGRDWEKSMAPYLAATTFEDAKLAAEMAFSQQALHLSEPMKRSMIKWAMLRLPSVRPLRNQDHEMLAMDQSPIGQHPAIQSEFQFPPESYTPGQATASVANANDMLLTLLDPMLRFGTPEAHRALMREMNNLNRLMGRERLWFARTVREWGLDRNIGKWVLHEFYIGPNGEKIDTPIAMGHPAIFSGTKAKLGFGPKFTDEQLDMIKLAHAAAYAALEYVYPDATSDTPDYAGSLGRAMVLLGVPVSDIETLKRVLPPALADRMIAERKAAERAATTGVDSEGNPMIDGDAYARELRERRIGLFRFVEDHRHRGGLIWTVPADWIEQELDQSEAKRILVDNGRDASRITVQTLTQEVHQEFDWLYQELSKNVGWFMSVDSPYLDYRRNYAPHIPGMGFLGSEEEAVRLALSRDIDAVLTAKANTFRSVMQHAFERRDPTVPRPLVDVSDRMFKYLYDLKGLPYSSRENAAREIRSGAHTDLNMHPDMTYADVVAEIQRELEQVLLARKLRQEDADGVNAPFKSIEDPLALARVARDAMRRMKRNEFSPHALRRSYDTMAARYVNTGVRPANIGAAEALHRYAGNAIKHHMRKMVLNQMVLLRNPDGTPLVIPDPSLDYDDDHEILHPEVWAAAADHLREHLNLRPEPGKSIKEQLTAMIAGHVEHDTKQYTRVEAHVFPSVRGFYAYKAGSDENVLDALFAGGEVAGYLKHVLERAYRDPYGVLESMEHVNAWMKQLALQLSLFFPLAGLESLTAASGTAIWNMKQGGPFQLVEWRRMIMAGHPYAMRLMEQAQDIGVTFSEASNPLGLPTHVIAKDIARGRERVTKLFGKRVGDIFDSIASAPAAQTDLVFEGFFNTAKLWLVHAVANQVRTQVEAAGGTFDFKRDMAPFARYIDDELGGQNWPRYAWMTPTWKRNLNLGFFSPNWTISAWNAAGGGLLTAGLFKNYSTAEASKFILMRRWPRMMAYVLLLSPAIMQLAMFAVGRLFGGAPDPDDDDDPRKNDNPFIWQNEKGKRMHADITPVTRLMPWYKGFPSGERRQYIRWGKQAYEVARWLDDPFQSAASKLSQGARWALEMATGEAAGASDWDLPFKDMGLLGLVLDREGEVFGSRLGYTIQKFLPFSVLGWARNPDAAPWQFIGAVSRGLSFGAATQAYEGLLRTWAENDTFEKVYNNKIIKANLEALGPEILDAAIRNGYDGDKVIDAARGAVMRDLYAGFFKSLDANNSREVDVWARKIMRLNGAVRNTRSSVKNRNRMYGRPSRLTDDQKRMIADAFKRP